ncbi:O-methyltransferase [Vibrio metschnikovii]
MMCVQQHSLGSIVSIRFLKRCDMSTWELLYHIILGPIRLLWNRGLFIQSLRKINKYLNISDYRYMGFGGLRGDFKALHHELKISDMVCIEVNENVRRRQQFNKPLSCIDFLDRGMLC